MTNQIVFDEKLKKQQQYLKNLLALQGSKFVKIKVKIWKLGVWSRERDSYSELELSQDVFLKPICFNVHESEWIEGEKF